MDPQQFVNVTRALGDDDRYGSGYRPSYRAGYGPPPRRRRSFLGEHVVRIVVGIIIVVGGAVVVDTWAPARRQVCVRIEIPTCPPDLQQKALGQWTFARYDPDRPHAQANGMTAVPKSVAFFEDGDYATHVVTQLEDGDSFDQRETGWYEVKSQGDGWARLKLSNSDKGGFLGIVLLEFGRRELRVTDEATNETLVYRRA